VAFPDDLLDLAQQLASLDGTNPRQATLRRSISTAYYALFHLLISTATQNWNRVETQAAFGRFFEHTKMKSACEKKVSELNEYFKGKPPDSPELTILKHLQTVASTFVQAYHKRADADYDTSKQWTQTEVLLQIDAVAEAFKSWQMIKDEQVAQIYLFSLLGKGRNQA
jgi:uncharacterized protein (UPF0332 family)